MRWVLVMLVFDDRVRFDLNEHAGIDKSGDLNHRRCGHDTAERFLMRPGNFLPLIDVGHKHSRTYDMLESRTSLIQGSGDYFDATTRLQVWIALADQLAVLIYRRTAGDCDMRPNTNGTTITDYRLPGCTRFYELFLSHNVDARI